MMKVQRTMKKTSLGMTLGELRRKDFRQCPTNYCGDFRQ